MVTAPDAGENMKKLIYCWQVRKMIKPLWKTVALSYEIKHTAIIWPGNCPPALLFPQNETNMHAKAYTQMLWKWLSRVWLYDPKDYTVHGILQARILEWVAFLFSRGSSPNRSPALHVDSLLSEPPGKPKNTGVGSLSFLQQIFPTQQSNQGLLHCRRILYQLSHKRSPKIMEWIAYPFSSRSS